MGHITCAFLNVHTITSHGSPIRKGLNAACDINRSSPLPWCSVRLILAQPDGPEKAFYVVMGEGCRTGRASRTASGLARLATPSAGYLRQAPNESRGRCHHPPLLMLGGGGPGPPGLIGRE